MKFNVGDRVIGTKRNLKDKKGTIVHIMNDNVPYGVKFDEKIPYGHDLGYDNNQEPLCKYGYGYWCQDSNIKLIMEPITQTKFKIGDRIKSKTTLGNRVRVGEIGTIVAIIQDDNIEYGVEFDNYIDGHSLNSANVSCKEGHGCWLRFSQLELLESNDTEDKKSTIKDLLKFGVVVELKCYHEKRIGIVTYGDKIETANGTHSLSDYNDNLERRDDDYISKIYENTNDGLELIWDRSEYDFTDWSKVEVDTKIQVKSCEAGTWTNRYFAKYESGKVYAYCNGLSSFTVALDTDTISWEFARLYEKE